MNVRVNGDDHSERTNSHYLIFSFASFFTARRIPGTPQNYFLLVLLSLISLNVDNLKIDCPDRFSAFLLRSSVVVSQMRLHKLSCTQARQSLPCSIDIKQLLGLERFCKLRTRKIKKIESFCNTFSQILYICFFCCQEKVLINELYFNIVSNLLSTPVMVDLQNLLRVSITLKGQSCFSYYF